MKLVPTNDTPTHKGYRVMVDGAFMGTVYEIVRDEWVILFLDGTSDLRSFTTKTTAAIIVAAKYILSGTDVL